jgi:pyruvate dehydrogenase E1 component beta subunit
MMMNVAGLKIVMPGTPADAKGLMYAAVREPSPVCSSTTRRCRA